MRKRTHALVWAWAVMLGIAIAPASATEQDVADYRALKDSLATLEFESTADLKDQIALIPARAVELRGRVAGEISGPQGDFYIFKPEGGPTLLLHDLGDSETLKHGHPARVLFWIPADTPTLEALLPLGYIWESQIAPLEEAERAEQERLQKEWEERMANVRVPTLPHFRQSSGVEREGLAMVVQGFNPRVTDKEALAIADSILRHCRRYQVNELLACSLVAAESRFNRWAVSRTGAQGLGQLMPGTARGLGVRDSFDPDENLRGALQYLSIQFDRFNDPILALAAYNAGPGAVQRYRGVPPYRETRNYVSKVWNTFYALANRPAS